MLTLNTGMPGVGSTKNHGNGAKLMIWQVLTESSMSVILRYSRDVVIGKLLLKLVEIDVTYNCGAKQQSTIFKGIIQS